MSAARFRPLRANEVEFEVTPEEEHVHPRDCFATGDEADDRAMVAEILRKSDAGDAWAWCSVKVTARWRGFVGEDSLGACSYDSEADFCQPGGYFDDMKERALDDLNAKIAGLGEKLGELFEE